MLSGIGVAICGGILLTLPYLPMHFYVAIAVSIGYGAILSPYQGVYGITQIELFGLDKLTASYGMSYFVQGVGVTIGPVLTGI